MSALSRAALLTASVGALTAFASGCGASDDAPAGAHKVSYKITDAGCEPAVARAPAGPITFDIENDGADSVTELEIMDGDTILGERENLTPGLSGSFSLTLEAGTYTSYCPNGERERGKLIVTGNSSAANDPADAAAAAGYKRYVTAETAKLVAATRPFAEAVQNGDVEQAKKLYPAARIPYERVEPVAESFGNLDPEIDARAGDVPDAQFGGFHKIEQALFVKNTTDGMSPVAAALLADVLRLQAKARGLEFGPAQIANGATELLDEVSASKITGEEERYSHTDLVDFEANVQGSEAAFNAIKPLLKDDPALVKEIEQRFADVYRTLQPYRRSDGYVLYTELTDAQIRELAQSVDALAEPLSEVSAQVAL